MVILSILDSWTLLPMILIEEDTEKPELHKMSPTVEMEMPSILEQLHKPLTTHTEQELSHSTEVLNQVEMETLSMLVY